MFMENFTKMLYLQKKCYDYEKLFKNVLFVFLILKKLDF